MARYSDRDAWRSNLRHLRALVVTTMLVVVFVVAAMCQGGTMPSPCSGITKVTEKVVGAQPEALAMSSLLCSPCLGVMPSAVGVPPSPLGPLAELIGASSPPLRV